jgi:hypothetical protein
VKQRILCVAWAAIGLSVSAAAADPVRNPMRMAQAIPGMLPAHEIAAIVRSAGFVPISPAMRRGESYVLRATAPDGREVRVIVTARSGEIVSALPVVAAARTGPPGERLAPYDRMTPPEPIPPQGYVGPGGVYEAGPPVVYEGDRPLRRPLAPVPNVPPRGARAAVPDAENNSPLFEPPVIMREERGEHGLLPPPPERFPQRAAPPAAPSSTPKPAPVKRAAATPLPKPRPAVAADTPAASAPQTQPAAAEGKVDARALPH